jgi:uncharacterized protein (DUF1778 family)
MAKSRRVDLRLDDDEDQIIRRAAALSGMTVSHFMLLAARERAERLLVDRAFQILDSEAWEAFTARLDAPPAANPALAGLFAEPDVLE